MSRLWTPVAVCLVAAAALLAVWQYGRRTYTITLWEGSGL